MADRTWKIHARAVLEQDVDDPLLYTGDERRTACRDQSERCASTVVHGGFRIHVGASRQQDLGDLRGIARRHLPVALHTVRRNIVKKRPPVLTRRAHACHLRMVAQHTLECDGIACDDGRDRPFERGDGRPDMRKRLDMLHKLGPAEEAMGPRDNKLRVGQRAPRGVTA